MKVQVQGPLGTLLVSLSYMQGLDHLHWALYPSPGGDK
jgi:hypothetical protein